MSHTPGPWIWRNKSGSLHQKGTDRRFGVTVLAPTYEYDSGVDTEVSDADAALIAAAPDLLAALKEILPWHDSHPAEATDNRMVNLCRAAIAKAEGAP